MSPVEIEASQDDSVVIGKGLAAGDRIVVSGQYRLDEGSRVSESDPSKVAQAPGGPVMNLSAIFIRRPIGTSLLMLAIAIAGVAAYPLLPLAPLPSIDFPTLQVSVQLPGASPDVMASAVATPLEKQIGLIPGVAQLTSSNTLGNTQITVQFDLDRDIDTAAQDVQAAITAASGQLPTNLPNPPTYRKVNPADPPILVLAVRSDALPITQVDDLAENLIAQQISQIAGVAQVSIGGQQQLAVRIQVGSRRSSPRWA